MKAYQKLVRDAPSATPGHRAWPCHDYVLDQMLGVRLDWGEMVMKDRKSLWSLNLQVNKDVKQNILKQMAGKDSHRKLVILWIDIHRPAGEEKFINDWKGGVEDLP